LRSGELKWSRDDMNAQRDPTVSRAAVTGALLQRANPSYEGGRSPEYTKSLRDAPEGGIWLNKRGKGKVTARNRRTKPL